MRVRCKVGRRSHQHDFVMGNHSFSLNMFEFEGFVRGSRHAPMRGDMSGKEEEGRADDRGLDVVRDEVRPPLNSNRSYALCHVPGCLLPSRACSSRACG